MINLLSRMQNNRATRTVLGKPSSSDISVLFESGETDFITGDSITQENFDLDDIWYIQGMGYTRRKSLIQCGFTKIDVESIHDPVEVKDLK